MTSITFDTLQFAKELETKGFSTKQAEGITGTLQKVINVAEVATTRDIKELELTLKNDIEKTKGEIIKWVMGLLVGQTALIIGVILKTLH
ncbi:MAG: CCDC90 family protein [Zoogloeaceae bacterium]|jgi:hypothetical protein|nr:CCDC90 family protein [Zoogloeaceae bacterium]